MKHTVLRSITVRNSGRAFWIARPDPIDNKFILMYPFRNLHRTGELSGIRIILQSMGRGVPIIEGSGDKYLASWFRREFKSYFFSSFRYYRLHPATPIFYSHPFA